MSYLGGFMVADRFAAGLREVIASTFFSVCANLDRRYCSCSGSLGSERNATFTRKRFSSDAIARLSECCERRAVSCRRISMRSMVSRSDCLFQMKLAREAYSPAEATATSMVARRLRHLGTRTKGNVRR